MMNVSNGNIDFGITNEFKTIICGNPSCQQEFLLFGILQADKNANFEGGIMEQATVNYCPYCSEKGRGLE